MVDFKITIAELKTGKSYQTIVNEPDSRAFIGKTIGEKINGEIINLNGYELLITGGSDLSGFPMRKDIRGTGRKKILAVSGVGIKKKKKGIKQRKTVCGNTIHTNISQINLKVVKEGSKGLGEIFVREGGKEEKAPEKEAKKRKTESKKEEKAGEEKGEKAKISKQEKIKKENKKETEGEAKEEKKAEKEEKPNAEAEKK